MRRLAITTLLVCMLSAPGAAVVSAQEPSPSVLAHVGRVEVPAAGYAVTLPEGWTMETHEVVEGTDSPDGPTEETRSIWSYAFAPDGSASCLLFEDRLVESLDDSSTALDETAAYHRTRYEPVLVEMSSVELPLGLAVRFVLDYTRTGDEGVGAVYLLSDGDALVVMSCVAQEPPDGDWWLSIAETIEFLPEE